jgi:hypothetical protein
MRNRDSAYDTVRVLGLGALGFLGGLILIALVTALLTADAGTAAMRRRAILNAALVPKGSERIPALNPSLHVALSQSAGDTLLITLIVSYAPSDGLGNPDSVLWIGNRHWPDSLNSGRAPAWGQYGFDPLVTSWTYQTLKPEPGDRWDFEACLVVKRREMYSGVSCSVPVQVERPRDGIGLIYDGVYVPPPAEAGPRQL